jgi:DNA mismatch endonuclease, patch repair protein
MATSPSYRGYRPASEAASRTGRGNRKVNTAPETLLRRALWRIGIRYRLHVPDVPGRPDIVIRKWRVAVFCDGDFWHGRNWPARRAKLRRGSNSDYWVKKISTNVARDRATNARLRSDGWLVLRFWESEIKKDPQRIAEIVAGAVRRRTNE